MSSLCIVYILFSEVIKMIQDFERISEMTVLKLWKWKKQE